METKRVGLIVCEIFFREVAWMAARSEEILDIVFMPKGLHDLGGDKMRVILQEEINKMNQKEYDRILLFYALCNKGTAGLRTTRNPVVIPRGHDCITLFMGSKERYDKFFFENTGTYFHTTGWVERGSGDDQYFDERLGPEKSLQGLIDKYGEENGKYLWEILNPARNYKSIVYINMPYEGLPDLRKQSQQKAKERELDWFEIQGDTGLLERLLKGPYHDEEFLILKPGYETFATHDERILDVKPCCCEVVRTG